MRTITQRLAEMNARIDRDSLGLDPLNGSPRVMCVHSYTPLDVGFDLRRHDMPIELPAGDRLRVRYVCDDEEERTIEGTRERVAQALAAAGYIVAGESCEGRR